MKTPENNGKETFRVAVTRCIDYAPERVTEAIAEHFTLHGGVEKFISRGDSVLLKPNFIAPKPRRQAAQTDPEVILAAAKIVKDYGGKPFLADSPAWGDIFNCVKALKMEEDLQRLGVPVKQLNKPKRCKIYESKLGVSTLALQADKIINLPKLKSHQQLGGTFAIKNMYGCVSGKEKAFWHFAKGKNYEAFCRMLIGVYEFLRPVLTIIDGIEAMEGKGPINGKPRSLGIMVSGIEPVACERACGELIKFEPEELPIIQTAAKMKFGCSDFNHIKFVGDDYKALICEDFQRAKQIPLRFSLGHMCKSVAKQAVLLGRSVRGRVRTE